MSQLSHSEFQPDQAAPSDLSPISGGSPISVGQETLTSVPYSGGKRRSRGRKTRKGGAGCAASRGGRRSRRMKKRGKKSMKKGGNHNAKK